MQNSTKISVIITSYNHENYIREAIESVLSQEDVDIEIIMSDDCSSDNTYQIMEEYASRYPNIVTLISNKKNLGLPKNMQNCISKTQGEYIAFCEGDDYWVDKHKLYKQAKFLNENDNASLCSNQVEMLNEAVDQRIEHEAQIKHFKNGNPMLSTKDVILNYFVGNFTSMLFRANVIKSFPNEIYNSLIADWFFSILASEKGFIYIIPEIMSIHRIHGNNFWIGKDNNKTYVELISTYNKLTNYRHDTYFKQLRSKINQHKKRQLLKRIVFLMLPPIITIGIVKIKKIFKSEPMNNKN